MPHTTPPAFSAEIQACLQAGLVDTVAQDFAQFGDLIHEVQFEAFPIIVWEAEPSGVVRPHKLASHRWWCSRTSRRCVVSIRLLGDNVRQAHRGWKPSPGFSAQADTPPASTPMDHPLFPLLLSVN